MDYLVVDGYNVINAWGHIFNPGRDPLEDCRERLLNILSNYQGFSKIPVIAVFDAHFVKGSQEKQESFDNITIVFTKENETADNYIEKFVYRNGSTSRITVVTSDYLEQTMVLSSGGSRMTPKELWEEVSKTHTSGKESLKRRPNQRNTIMSNIKPELLEVLEKLRRGK